MYSTNSTPTHCLLSNSKTALFNQSCLWLLISQEHLPTPFLKGFLPSACKYPFSPNTRTMVPTPSTTSALHIQFLRKCQSNAQQLKDLLRTLHVTAPPPSTYKGPIPDLDLPFPHDILLEIDDMGLPKHICERVKSIVTEKILQSQRVSIEIYQRTCYKLPRTFISSEYLSNLAETYEAFYNNNEIPKFRAEVSTFKANFDIFNKHRTQETRRPIFNSVRTFILFLGSSWLKVI
jgi:hypothetical protein